MRTNAVSWSRPKQMNCIRLYNCDISVRNIRESGKNDERTDFSDY